MYTKLNNRKRCNKKQLKMQNKFIINRNKMYTKLNNRN